VYTNLPPDVVLFVLCVLFVVCVVAKQATTYRPGTHHAAGWDDQPGGPGRSQPWAEADRPDCPGPVIPVSRSAQGPAHRQRRTGYCCPLATAAAAPAHTPPPPHRSSSRGLGTGLLVYLPVQGLKETARRPVGLPERPAAVQAWQSRSGCRKEEKKTRKRGGKTEGGMERGTRKDEELAPGRERWRTRKCLVLAWVCEPARNYCAFAALEG
jgi:hypothetical protein